MDRYTLQHGRRFDVWALVPAILLPVIMVFGANYQRGQSSESLVGTPGRLVVSCLVGLGFTALLYGLISAGYRRLDASVDHSVECGPSSFVQQWLRAKGFWFRFLVLLMPWLAWWFIHYPGVLDDDTIYQLLQSEGLSRWDNHHPVFDTWVFGKFWNLGDRLGSKSIGLAIFAVLNIICTAVAIAIALRYMRVRGAPRRLVNCLMIGLALVPIIPMFAMSMTKDYLFSWIYLLLSVVFIEVLRTNGAALQRRCFLVLVAALALFTMLTKQTGFYVVIAAAIVVLLRVLGWRLKLRAACAFGVPIVMAAVFVQVVQPLLGVAKTSSAEMYSLPMQQVARVMRDHPDQVSLGERAAISRVMPVDKIGQVYDPGRADAVKATWTHDADRSDTIAFFKTWLRLGRHHLGTYIDAFAFLNLGYFYPVAMDDLYDQINPAFFDDSGMHYWYAVLNPRHTTFEETREHLIGIEAPAGRVQLRNEANSVYAAFRHAPVLGELISGAAFCFWIPFLIAIYLRRRKNYLALVALIPFLVNFLTLITGPIALPRYMSTCIYLIPLALLLPYLRGSGVEDAGVQIAPVRTDLCPRNLRQ